MVRAAFVPLFCTCAVFDFSPALAARLMEPLRFFEGRTESVATLKTAMSKPRRVTSLGHGTVGSDGSLTLIQDVQGEGKGPHQRVWRIRRVAVDKYTGTMSEAAGPVTISQVGDRYRFRFKLRSGLSAEEWLSPSSDGRSATSTLTVRSFGIVVARSEGVIRRLPQQASTSR